MDNNDFSQRYSDLCNICKSAERELGDDDSKTVLIHVHFNSGLRAARISNAALKAMVLEDGRQIGKDILSGFINSKK